MTRLSEFFTLDEMVASDVARAQGIDNTPGDDVVRELAHMCLTGLDPIRRVLGFPMNVTSGYRCARLNAAVGGSPTSDHMKGLACDFVSPGAGTPLAICHEIAASDIPFDQLIHEGSWVHVGFGPGMRRQKMGF